jgi:hypothetical protein
VTISQLTLQIAESADFDGDGDVDGRDFLIWQRGYSSVGTATRATGDANGDGQVDAADLTVWQEQYGAVMSSQALTVPEAHTWLLCMGMAIIISLVRPQISKHGLSAQQ